MKPVVKWVGGKTQLLPVLREKMPDRFKTYIEPFFGGGALYFDVEPRTAIIGDNNRQLMNVYRMIVMFPDKLMAALDKMMDEYNSLPDDKRSEYYYARRSEYNELAQALRYDVESASLFIFLNKCCYNGLYRVNQKGDFNTPWGKKTKLNLYDRENILAVSKKLLKADIMACDFEKIVSLADHGDFVFFDSPYYETFDNYQTGGFSVGDHQRLSRVFDDLSQKGVFCLLTNSNTDFIKDLYEGYNITEVPVKRMVNSDASNRVGVEVIVTNY